VILAMSPLAAADVAMAAVTASLAAGNRTIVTFPAGADTRVQHAIGSLADRLGGRVLSLATGAVLAADPDVDLGHVVSVGATPRQRRELLRCLTTDFPVDEWNERVGADAQSADALAPADCAARL
jgi:opacity protein-like surface antigen